jgi:Bacteriocin-protection, YdeI or OmpD-Associated/Domain of unknown function (DUF1905)
MTERTFPAMTEPRKSGGITIRLPFDPAEPWGDRDKWYVHGAIDGRTYRGSVERSADGAAIDLGPAWCRDPAVGPGHEVTVVMRLEGPQLDTIDPTFAAALRAEPAARRTFESLASFYRKDFADWVGSAKRDETRERRIAESVALLKDGRTRS